MTERKVDTIKIQGGADYAKVAARSAAFHEDNSECSIVTECEFKDGFVLFTARVATKGVFSGHSMDKLGGRQKQFEKLETIAVGRTLAFAGYLASGDIATYEEMADVANAVSVTQLNSLKLKFSKLNADDLEGLDRAQQQQAFNHWAHGVVGEEVNYLDVQSWETDWFTACWRELTGTSDDVPPRIGIIPMALTQRTKPRFLDCSNMTMEEAEQYGELLAELQRDIHFLVGDLARYSEAKWPEKHHQVWPEWISPGLLSRTAAVSKAYPTEEERATEATWTQYIRRANQPDRLKQLESDCELTSDESRETKEASATDDNTRHLWLLAFDVHYFTHRTYYSGAGVETAMQVSEWLERTVERLREKGVTDVLCAFEGRGSVRKELVEAAGWEDRYKDRPPKPSDLPHQLSQVRKILEGMGFACCHIDGYEADDVLASAANQFPGKTTIITADKDLRQCLSDSTNMLLDIEWKGDEHSGDLLPEYRWLSAKSHFEATGIRAEQWADYQAIWGDNVDGIKGVAGIGEKGAALLIQEYGIVENAIQAARDGDDRIKPKKREAPIEFADKLEITRQLVTLKTDLEVPKNTKI